MKTNLLLFCSLFMTITSFAQYDYVGQQYFDGADTAAYNSILIDIPADSTNIWQIGRPQKIIFDSATSQPNVLITDTIQPYPPNNTSSFTFKVNQQWLSWGIFGFQWMQKLDLDSAADGGIVEYSLNGAPWENVFNNPYVYNFYGFNSANVDTLPSGEIAFSGTDSTWRDIWLCFDYSFLNFYDSLSFRFTMKSDSVDNHKEGWMIDNMLTHVTIIHTAKGLDQEEYLKVYPLLTDGVVNIQAKKMNEFHVIEKMELINVEGKVVKQYGLSPTKFFINIGDEPNGVYFLKIRTNLKTETFRIVLNRQ